MPGTFATYRKLPRNGVHPGMQARRVSCSPGGVDGAGALVRPTPVRAPAPSAFAMPAACRDVPLRHLLAPLRCGGPGSPVANGLLGAEHAVRPCRACALRCVCAWPAYICRALASMPANGLLNAELAMQVSSPSVWACC